MDPLNEKDKKVSKIDQNNSFGHVKDCDRYVKNKIKAITEKIINYSQKLNVTYSNHKNTPILLTPWKSKIFLQAVILLPIDLH